MAILVCRKCRSDAKIENISYQYRKTYVRVECTNCGKVWIITFRGKYCEEEIRQINANQIQLTQSHEPTKVEKYEPPQTAMAIAIAKALGNQKTDKGKL